LLQHWFCANLTRAEHRVGARRHRMSEFRPPTDDLKRATSLIDFLEDFYRLARPPIRSIAEYNEFLLREPSLPRVAGVHLSPAAETWLTVTLQELPPRPTVTPDLGPWLTQGTLSPLERPAVALTDISTDAELEAAVRIDEWAQTIWDPWAANWARVEENRNFYKRLYAVREQLDRNRDAYELVWGFGRLRWTTNKGFIDHPLITVAIELILDDGNDLCIRPVGPPEIEAACLVEVPLADRSSYQSFRQNGAADDVELWETEARTELLQRLLRFLDLDGHNGSSDSPHADGTARLDDEWVVFVRRREADYVGFLEAQRNLCKDGIVPTLPFLSLVAEQPSQLSGLIAPTGDLQVGPSRSDAQDNTLFLPKPANEDQHRILRLAQGRAGVTAQGPPGTGKSHTIANLVCHFVAQGKRVLVTAEKEQALAVLAEKLPPEVRNLSVSVLGRDEIARSRLEHAINVIQDRVGSYDEALVRSEISRLGQRLAEIDETTAAATNQLRAARAAETTRLTGSFEAGVDPSPAEVAQWLRANESALAIIADPLTLKTPIPLQEADWILLVQLARELDPDDIAHCRLSRPQYSRLPDGVSLHLVWQELNELRNQLADAESNIADWKIIDATTPDQLAALIERLERAAEWQREVGDTWLLTVESECTDPLTLESWQEFTETVQSSRETAVLLRRQTLAFQIDVPTPPINGLADGLRAARERYMEGKGISRLLHRSAFKAVNACSVDGRRPSSADDVELCLAILHYREQQHRIRVSWSSEMERIGGPSLKESTPTEDAVAPPLAQLTRAIEWATHTWPGLVKDLTDLRLRLPETGGAPEIEALVAVLKLVRLRTRERELTRLIEALTIYLKEGQTKTSSHLWDDLASALDKRHWESWNQGRSEAARLEAKEEEVAAFDRLGETLGKAAPNFKRTLTESRCQDAPDYKGLNRAWIWSQLESWLSPIIQSRSPADLQRELEDLAQQRLRIMESLVTARATEGLVRNFDDEKRGALNRYLTAVKRFGKTGGKYAARWLREIRDALDQSKDAVPVWIMPTSRVLASFRPEAKPPFDVLIVDEASQIGLLGIPILALADKAIVVGDDQQTSPENVGLDRQGVFDLIDDHLQLIRNARTLFDADNSLYDVSRQKFPDVVVLHEHFRSLPSIISFSNSRYYGGAMVPLRDRAPSPGWRSVGTVFVEDGFRDGRDINEPEAQAVTDLVAEFCADPTYEGMSFGVVTLLGKSQSLRVQDLLLDRLGPDVLEERNIRCGEAPDFQGDERDVIVISTVVDKPEGKRLGAMTDRRSERRLNVAASRAKNQLWIVHSLEPEDFPTGDPRAELIRHCQNPVDVEMLYSNLEDRCESKFETDVLRQILARGYKRVRTQHEVGRYRIDIVVEGPEGRLAVECDGDAWHGPDRWNEDRMRQQKLERSGWTFERTRASAFYRNPNSALEGLWRRLTELDIPTGDWDGDAAARGTRRVATPMAERRAADAGKLPPQFRPPSRGAEPEEGGSRREAPQPPTGEAPGSTSDDRFERPEHAPDPPRQMPTDSAIPRGSRQALAPYVEWAARPVGTVSDSDPDQVMNALVEIVSEEGPIHAQRLYQVHARAAGGQRVGRDMRQHYNRLLSQLLRAGRVEQVKDDLLGLAEKTIYLPGRPPILIRELGPRQLTEVPRSEVQALMQMLGKDQGAAEPLKRAVLQTLNLNRLTQKADQYLDECIGYRSQIQDTLQL
jgi:very-short-patch-repair endonuclease